VKGEFFVCFLAFSLLNLPFLLDIIGIFLVGLPEGVHKALKEAFEGFCSKNVAGSTSAELMANFCDNPLKKVRLGVLDQTLSNRSDGEVHLFVSIGLRGVEDSGKVCPRHTCCYV
jgi:hypothetical protein